MRWYCMRYSIFTNQALPAKADEVYPDTFFIFGLLLDDHQHLLSFLSSLHSTSSHIVCLPKHCYSVQSRQIASRMASVLKTMQRVTTALQKTPVPLSIKPNSLKPQKDRVALITGGSSGVLPSPIVRSSRPYPDMNITNRHRTGYRSASPEAWRKGHGGRSQPSHNERSA